jgi:hypothetical protein
MVVGLFLFHDMRRRSIQIMLYLVVTLVVVFMYGDAFYEEVINPRMEKEIEVIQGERETSQAFHGRMWRWQWLWGNYERSSFLAKMIGYPYDQEYSKHMVGITPHNDFLRMFFFVGIIGFITYLVFLVRITRRVKYLNKSDRFVSIALLSSLVLYSITTVPTFYVGFVNMYATLFAFLALPRQVLLKYRND